MVHTVTQRPSTPRRANLTMPVPVYLPFYLQSFSNDNSVRAGALLSVVGVAWAISSTQYKRLERRLSYEQILVVTFLLLGAAYVLLGEASTYSVVVTALVFTGLGLGSTIPNLNAWMLSMTPPDVKGRVIGIGISITFLGQFVSPVITQPLTSAIGIPHSYVVVGVGMAAIAASTFARTAVRAWRGPMASTGSLVAPARRSLVAPARRDKGRT